MAKNSGSTRMTRPTKTRSSEYIQNVLHDLHTKSYSEQPPMRIANAERRMLDYAHANNIEISDAGLYLTSSAIAHAIRDTKQEKGITVPEKDLVSFPQNYKRMDLYYDTKKETFVYTNNTVKFIVHPNYRIKIKRNKTKVVNFITASKTEGKEFKQKNYRKI